MVPKIMYLQTSFQTPAFPKGGEPTRLGRSGSLVVWAKPNPIKRVRTLRNGKRVLPNRGDVILRGN